MNEFQYSDSFNTTNMQIWNNAAFDNQEMTAKASWSSMNPILVHSSDSFPGKENHTPKNASEVITRDERNIDVEIEAVEKEIRRLTSRLESLKLEKLAQSIKITEKRGKVVASKFMEPKGVVKKSDPVSSSKKVDRRGVSLGPAEIYGSAKAKQLGGGKQEMTPMQSRRKSCLLKLEGIDERGKSMSLSPKSRKLASRIEASRQALTTVGSKRAVKKEDGILSSVQPKRLFKDVDKSLSTNKKTVKPGRIVASRYYQISGQTNGNSALKRSLPECGKNDSTRCDKRRASVVGKSGRTEIRVRNKWDATGVAEGDDVFKPSVANMVGALARIRTDRGVGKTPRDSGQAKRVAELVGRKSYFCSHAEAEASVCQALNFAEED